MDASLLSNPILAGNKNLNFFFACTGTTLAGTPILLARHLHDELLLLVVPGSLPGTIR